MATEKLHHTYARALQHQPLGHALFIPVESKDMYPGCIGAFNDDGIWIKANWDVMSTGHGFTPITEAELQVVSMKMKPDTLFHSQKISEVKVQVQAGMPLFQKASVKATFQIDSTSDAAAILQCGPITRVGIGNLDLDIQKWGKKNKEAIFKEAKNAKRFGGFFIVTAIYKTEWCRTRCWSSASLESMLALQLDVNGSSSSGASLKMSIKKTDKSGFSLPVGKGSKGGKFVVFVEGVLVTKGGKSYRNCIYGC